ncbi:pyridoxal kinase PdxY [Tessaracoccus antarcticus]|uniref:pyridoxal kinase n=1 Tax=Tessaracoccus antarcticus TaxID=2479848 RepID=A0A3M0GEW9_9ACTN|nr:pyridoxal kinase PdxY [Tessaracoccus antarcticus]RMB60143.1 pyridoxal kinase PdxY [Tessaracoccus antarcticus]
MHTVLSIQSAVAYGHAGNSSAVFPMQRSGVNVWPVYTVNFSNHTGYETWRGPMIDAQDVASVIQGVDERGVLPQVSAVLSGYQGSADMGQVILDAAALVKKRNPAALFCADPVLGDVGRGFYARPGIPEFMRDHVVQAADILTPNLFELQYLTGRTTGTVGDVLAAAEELRARGPRIVLVTSVVADDMVPDPMRMLAVGENEAWLVETPLIDRTFTGSGDLTTAMFLTHWLKTGDLAESLSQTASIVYSILEQTATSGVTELQLVAAQDNIVNPTHTFKAIRLS